MCEIEENNTETLCKECERVRVFFRISFKIRINLSLDFHIVSADQIQYIYTLRVEFSLWDVCVIVSYFYGRNMPVFKHEHEHESNVLIEKKKT